MKKVVSSLMMLMLLAGLFVGCKERPRMLDLASICFRETGAIITLEDGKDYVDSVLGDAELIYISEDYHNNTYSYLEGAVHVHYDISDDFKVDFIKIYSTEQIELKDISLPLALEDVPEYFEENGFDGERIGDCLYTYDEGIRPRWEVRLFGDRPEYDEVTSVGIFLR